MKTIVFVLAGLLIANPVAADTTTGNRTEKQTAIATIESHREEMIRLSDEIWRYAETALQETRSSKALADWAEKNGFRVRRDVPGLPTAFVAEYGSGRPVIGILGEYDALPGISQKAQASKEALDDGAGGHGCGHNLFGVGSLGAAIAIRDLIEAGRLKGTIRFFGTPAEEAVGGKTYMLRDGVMDGVDVMLAWHPGSVTQADTKSTQAIVDITVDFRGTASHAAYDPWNGRSALDGLEIFTHAVNLMREHIKPTARMHYVVTKGGQVPNVVPEEAQLWMWLRALDRDEVDSMLQRIKKIAEGAALAAGVETSVLVGGGGWNMLVNMTGQRLAHANLEAIAPLEFTEEEQEFAKTIQRATGVEPRGLITGVKPFDDKPGPAEGGSTDVADVSWVVPTIHLSVTTAPAGAPWHGWSVVSTSGMSIGHKGMIFASKALAATMIDLFLDPDARAKIRSEFEVQTKGVTFVPYIPDGPPRLPPGQ